VNGQRTRAQREERKEKQRDPVGMFAEGECVAQRIKQVRVIMFTLASSSLEDDRDPSKS
jgi:hypothetical protein